MDLVALDDVAKQCLVDMLLNFEGDGSVNRKSRDTKYVAKTFPVLLDICRVFTEQSVEKAREAVQGDAGLIDALKPYFIYSLLLGKSPQVNSLMYHYFETSLFQPLPDNFFNIVDKQVSYNHPCFSDNLVKEILHCLFKYLSYDPLWFSKIWNWSELGRIVTIHPNLDLRYLAGCCLSLITKPTRSQHISFLRNIVGPNLIELQVKHRRIFENTFRPYIEIQKENAEKFADSVGRNKSGYKYSADSIAKVGNVLLLKRDILPDKEKNSLEFIPVKAFDDVLSKISYSISVSRPCLVRGSSGCGKTAILDFIAAQVNRFKPPEYIKVQISDQLDSKLLIGSYICTEIPGQFEWQPGPLTKALIQGSWIVFEDIASAPADMIQVIHSVIENGKLSCVSSCPIKLDKPHPDFRVFFTQRVRTLETRHEIELIKELCDIVDVPNMSDQDIDQVIQGRYKLGVISKTILQLFGLCKTNKKNNEAKQRHKCITLRDLFKLCERLKKNAQKASQESYSAQQLEDLFLNAIDCFLASIPRASLEDTAENLGQILNIPSNEVKRIIHIRRPEIVEDPECLRIGRAVLKYFTKNKIKSSHYSRQVAHTRQSLQILESVALSVLNLEPILLVGETGVGKTLIVQHLADLMNVDLIVVNLCHQSDSSDLIGSYKPVDMREIIRPIHDEFEDLFRKTYDVNINKRFLLHVNECFLTPKSAPYQWTVYLKLLTTLCIKAQNNKLTQALEDSWTALHLRARRLLKRVNLEKKSSPMALKFAEGSLLSALKNGKWILLDEINLAEPEVLQCIWLILDSMGKSRVYMTNGNEGEETFAIHKNFRLFACMNPSTDIGKRDLDLGTRSRFTEFFFDDITEKSELRLIAEAYVKSSLTTKQIESVVNFYLELRDRRELLRDVSGNSPVFSLRTLCRALLLCSNNVCHNMEKSLYESLCVTFLQQLDEQSTLRVMKLIEQNVFTKETMKSLVKVSIPQPQDGHQYVMVQGFWIQKSNEEPVTVPNYVLTPFVEKNLQNIARIISLSQRKLPILLQGNTAVGKTSLIVYLARLTGNKCYRINNHEHTDLQEYVGRYVLREDGELVFQEGLLVRAMKKGYWLILDELNLAPCELLEALNRVLDENRELYITETGETIKAHSKFVLFATQNPPQEYAGRKLLSRAFRNRFIELNFNNIPRDQLETILEKRCQMPPQYAKKIIEVMVRLQLLSRESGCFNGRNSYMTMRDLFRWGERYLAFKESTSDSESLDWKMVIANQGLVLLEGRARTQSEADTVKEVIDFVFNKTLDREQIYVTSGLRPSSFSARFKHIYFSQEFKKMFLQLDTALKYKEPVLLCGQTGCGKTTACQLYADILGLEIITYNCHQNTESADFVGGVRPTRSNDPSAKAFEWVDGPLIEAMKRGAIFLMDEISLADDAVLERINSVLEPERSITLTERNGDEIYARDSFRLVATMNPGGDYGKKELSTALRNRFTEIYCHNTTQIEQIRHIIQASLSPTLLKAKIAPNMLHIMTEFLKSYYSKQDIISIRDVLSWCKFIDKTVKDQSHRRPLTIQEALVEGASLVFFDQFGTCGHSTTNLDDKFETKALLKGLVKRKFGTQQIFSETSTSLSTFYCKPSRFSSLLKGPDEEVPNKKNEKDFIIEAPTVRKGIRKIIRAMELDKPILLEGAPGSGKTSIVCALAKMSGHKLVRINLSDQTDICDLIGTDLPSSSSSDNGRPSFSWHDGPFLRAIKEKHWILLDEMNLASQSVLEGLNSVFDHRGEIFIPELDEKVVIDKSTTRVFACQNPHIQGASRKGLPKSFLNRFTSIFMESHTPKDLFIIIKNKHPSLPEDMITKMIKFNNEVREFHQIHGFEFNLRDILYWCELSTKYVRNAKLDSKELYKPELFAQFVYSDRMRMPQDKLDVSDLFEQIFEYPMYEPLYFDIQAGESSVIFGRSILSRRFRPPPHLFNICILKYQLPYMESIAKAIEFNKMPIIVGEPGVGKRSMIRVIAGLTGNELNIIGANCEMDTSEFLGSFEQKSAQREIEELVRETEKCVQDIVNSYDNKRVPEFWKQIFTQMWLTSFPSSLRDQTLSKIDLLDTYRTQLTAMQELINTIKSICGKDMVNRLTSLAGRINDLRNKVLSSDDSMYSAGNFQWIDSTLTKAIREGSWLLIEDASLIDPAMFDRLNSLFEPNGSIALTEKGSGPEGLEILVPHKDFRLILTVNPNHGELSAAIRNRGVEIFVRPRFYFEDFLMLLNQNGFEEPEENTTSSCMLYCIMQTSYDVHKKLTGEDPAEDGSLLSYFGLNYIPILSNEVRRGVNVDDKLADLLFEFYKLKGYEEDEEVIRKFTLEQMSQYRQTYMDNPHDERYRWKLFRHDLAFLTGGDSITEKLDRENTIFHEDCNSDLLMKPDEQIQNFDVVNTCTALKIFLENSTHADFAYRMQFLVENFSKLPELLIAAEEFICILKDERIRLMENHVPKSDLIPLSDLPVDTRNLPYVHYLLQVLNQSSTSELEVHQNRWLLTLQRIMLSMIVSLVDKRTKEDKSLTSLYELSSRVREGTMMKEQLINPIAVIVYDLFELLDGLLQQVSNRYFDNHAVIKMFPRFFWIISFVCKLRKRTSEFELIAICNQIPMLWILTYQKIIVPIIEECQLADVKDQRGRKFSHRLQHICDCLDVPVTATTQTEKLYRLKVINPYATTLKLHQVISEEVGRFFARLLGKYTSRSISLNLSGDSIVDTLSAAGLIWSNSIYSDAFYTSVDKALNLEAFNLDQEKRYFEVLLEIDVKKQEYDKQEDLLCRNNDYKSRCLGVNRGKCALDQFAPLWQLEFIQSKLASLDTSITDSIQCHNTLKRVLKSINGLVLSPRYYFTVSKFLKKLQNRNEANDLIVSDESANTMRDLKESVDMYTTILVDHILENVVLDSQIVGWTKLRVTTCDLPVQAPLIPEYSPIISLVGSYSLDVAHLKLNSYWNLTEQLDSALAYFWHNYVNIKVDGLGDKYDLELARRLVHLREEMGMREELVGSYSCDESTNCCCVDEYIRRRLPKYDEFVGVINEKLPPAFVKSTLKAAKMIYFGYFNYLEYAPLFTIDPSIRAREKLDVYKSELAHIRMDLSHRNTLFYYKTGENLQLNEIDSEGAAQYPFSTRILVDRRVKLEKSINKLRQQHSTRPKSNDGSLYYDLRKEVEVDIELYTNCIHSLMNDILAFACCQPKSKEGKFNNLVTKCRTFTKNLEKSIQRFRSEYSLYSDLTTNFLVGMCFVLQGLRCLYAKFEQHIQVDNFGFKCSIEEFFLNIKRVFSFNDNSISGLESVKNKLKIFPLLEKVCPQDETSRIQSILLHTVLIQLNHHIVICPPDIKKCIPIVRSIADLFNAAWIKRKQYLEEKRKQSEELYQYKNLNTTLGREISYEKQEFLDICSNFPLYDHIYQDHLSIVPTSAEKENLETEAKIINLNRAVDLSLCIDICKAHYKFTKEAGCNLLGLIDTNDLDKLPKIELKQVIRLEAETLYSIVRHVISTFDTSFDSFAIECHMLQANQLKNIFKQPKRGLQRGSLKSSIEILDENVFDVYLDADATESIKLQEFVIKLNERVHSIQTSYATYESDFILTNLNKLITKISSFLLSDPLMKFITGSHALLEKIEEWNRQPIPAAHKLIEESYSLIDLIKSWREIEVQSWRSSLHRVKRKFIDNRLCDLWFTLYEAFKNPINTAQEALRRRFGPEGETFVLTKEFERFLYEGFALFIKEFIRDSTFGDCQIRLDLVFSFVIQTRFASLYKLGKLSTDKNAKEVESELVVDHEKLTSYVYNTYRLHQGVMKHIKKELEREEEELSKKLNDEIRFVAWQGRNLWEIKNNFRISHRKINRVMNKYLEVLRRPQPGYLRHVVPLERLSGESEADKLSNLLSLSYKVIDNIKPPLPSSIKVEQLKKISLDVVKMKELFGRIYEPACRKYAGNLTTIEQAIRDNSQEIENFNAHKVQDVVIGPKDTKETKENKHKLCRQMYHSKKSALQRVFKELKNLGVSYQRGRNSSHSLDSQLLALEPLRGMILEQNRSVSEDKSWNIEEKKIISCSVMYQELIAQCTHLLSEPARENLTTDELSRIRGYTLDIEIDIIKQKRGAANIYKHLTDIHAAAARLRNLRENSVLFNFSRVYQVIREFNELAGKSYMALAKYEELASCRIPLAKPRELIEDGSDERSVIFDLVSDIRKDYSIITEQQYSHINSNLPEVRKMVSEVSYELRDMLNCNMRNYLFSSRDHDRLTELCDKFSSALKKLLFDCQNVPNSQPGTLIGSFWSLLNEVELKVKPEIEEVFTTFESKPNSDQSKLHNRLLKLFQQIKLAIQELYEKEHVMGQQANLKLKPYNLTDSNKIEKALRISNVAKFTGDCFLTLNKTISSSLVGSDVSTVVSSLTPVLTIYTQDVAFYLNTILSTLHLKLTGANQLIPFFATLIIDGFGLPQKIIEDTGTEGKAGASSEDNAGFGEGQGEIDASKKIDFESQLDDLKAGDGESQGESTVEAHDDGIEMSDDIDAKAEGASKEDNNQESSDGDEDEEENLNELDQEMDTVDQAEGKLKPEIWGDEEEPPVEDDETDLRDADVDPTIETDKEEADLRAKDEGLASQKLSSTKDEKKELKGEDDDYAKVEENDAQNDTEEDIDGLNKGKEQVEEDLNVEDEAQLAIKNAEIEESKAEDGISEISDEIEFPMDTEKAETRSEGELSSEDGTEEVLKSQEETLLDDSEIDDQLENAATTPADLLEDPIEEVKRKQSEATQASGEGGPSLKSMSFGDEVYVCFFDEEDVQEEEEEDLSNKDGEKTGGDSKQQKQQGSNFQQGDDGAQLDADDEPDDDNSLTDHKKRVRVESIENEDNREIKRQKIMQANETPNKQKEDDSKKTSGSSKQQEFRHIQQDNEQAIPVIDLVSSDDESDCLVEDQSDVDEQRNPLEPKMVEQRETAEKANFAKALNLVPCEDKAASLMEQIDQEVSKESEPMDSLDTERLTSLWLDCTKNNGHLVQELCQQLQIVLQPTKMSKYKGDYKSGKRLNMRKLISYIASDYRKDKIWLRRTKPSKRTYNIILAVDNSASMSDNNCRQMSYQSLALLAKSLSLIEAGSLSIVSFGEIVRCIHDFGQPYCDAIGAQFLRELRFNESKTSYKALLKYSCESFAKQAQVSAENLQSTACSQLLVILSDGRNVTSEEEEVRSYLKQLKSMGILTLFMIIDDLKKNSGKSIVEVMRSVGHGANVSVVNYMEYFPFPFYLLVRQMETMPLTLGDALRQWFELVT